MNIIELNFIPTVTRITGNKYGYTTYNEQIKPKIKENEKNIKSLTDTGQGAIFSLNKC